MSFLDDIGQRSPGTSQRSVRSTARDLPYQEADRVTRVEPSYQEAESDDPRSSMTTWAVVLIVVVVIASGGWMGLRRMAATSAAAEKAAAAAATEAEAAPPPEAPAPQPRTARPRPHATRAALNRSTTATDVVGTTTPALTSDTTSDVSSPAVADAVEQRESPDVPADATASAVEADAPAAVANEDDGIYSNGTPGIIAPQLESLGFAPNLLGGYHARTSRIELLISKSGTVERAKVTTPSYNMQDAMLVSRAKTLQFVPAYKDGAPVRYQLVLEVDTAP